MSKALDKGDVGEVDGALDVVDKLGDVVERDLHTAGALPVQIEHDIQRMHMLNRRLNQA
jgi:hypothetical protein